MNAWGVIPLTDVIGWAPPLKTLACSQDRSLSSISFSSPLHRGAQRCNRHSKCNLVRRGSRRIRQEPFMGALENPLARKQSQSPAESVRHARMRNAGAAVRVAQVWYPHASQQVDSIAGAKLEDSDLIREAISGNPEAQEGLFNAFTPRLYRTAFGILRNRQDAEDVVQESWCRAFMCLESFEGRSAFSTWLTRIVINSALMFRRRKVFGVEVSLNEILENDSQSFFDEASDAPNPEELCAANELSNLFEEKIGRLSPRIRNAFRLCNLEEFSIAEAAEHLGIGKTTIKSRIARGRRKVSRGLSELLSTQPRRQTSRQGS
jgi:RNA polymerase sigma-70 factor, ECF subfamily